MTSSARSLRTPGRGCGASASLGAVRQASLPAAPHANAFDQHAQHDAFLLKGLKKFAINARGPAERVDPYGPECTFWRKRLRRPCSAFLPIACERLPICRRAWD